jgi:hypothetical protein
MSQIQILKPQILQTKDEELEELGELQEPSINNDEIEKQIAIELNQEMHEVSNDVGMLYVLYHECQNLIFGQGESLDEVEENLTKSLVNVQEGTAHLEKADQYQKHSRGKVFDICMLAGGIGGFWIGIPTIIAGVGLSGGIVLARNKLENL